MYTYPVRQVGRRKAVDETIARIDMCQVHDGATLYVVTLDRTAMLTNLARALEGEDCKGKGQNGLVFPTVKDYI
jgi:hypothetical protein